MEVRSIPRGATVQNPTGSDVDRESISAHHAHFTETRVHAQTTFEGRRGACDVREDVDRADKVGRSIAPGCQALTREAGDGGAYRTVGRKGVGRVGLWLWAPTQVDQPRAGWPASVAAHVRMLASRGN